MPFTENRAVFFADFGVPALIGQVVGVPADVLGDPVTVIFDNEYLASLGVESSNPVALADDADVAGVSQGISVIVNAVNYTVAESQPDGTGFTVLELERV